MTTQSSPVIISQNVYDAIVEHAREGKPEEVCGILRGRGLTALEAIRGQNVATDRINNYDVDPKTLLLQFKFEEAGEEMMGIYHSHPISEAYPSATDAWNAHYPEAIYFICSLEFDEAPVLRAFGMVPHFIDIDAGHVRLDALHNTLPFREIRPDSHVFAYYQSPEENIPGMLEGFTKEVSPPFYVEFFQGPDEDGAELRVIDIHEYPVQIVA